MNRREIIQYIRHEITLSGEQKASLIRLLYSHFNNFGSLCGWIKSLNIIALGTFQELFSFARMEVVKTLIKGTEDRIWRGTFEKLMEIFFETSQRFSQVVLSLIRNEKERQVKAHLVQLLLHLQLHPAEGSTGWDYVPGIHHRDEVFRCKVLHFLYEHFGAKALPAILQEAIRIVPPPSLFFSMALNHYLRLNPEVMEDETIRRAILPSPHSFRGQAEKDRTLNLFQQMRYPIQRHDFLLLIHTQEEPEVSSIPHENLTRLRLERFDKIDSYIDK